MHANPGIRCPIPAPRCVWKSGGRDVAPKREPLPTRQIAAAHAAGVAFPKEGDADLLVVSETFSTHPRAFTRNSPGDRDDTFDCTCFSAVAGPVEQYMGSLHGGAEQVLPRERHPWHHDLRVRSLVAVQFRFQEFCRHRSVTDGGRAGIPGGFDRRAQGKGAEGSRRCPGLVSASGSADHRSFVTLALQRFRRPARTEMLHQRAVRRQVGQRAL